MKPVTTYKLLPLDQTTSARYTLDAMRKQIFEPLGIKDVSCTPANSATDARAYAPNATDTTKGSLLENAADECAGYRGLRLSSLEMVKVLANLRHGTLVDPADRALMDQQLLGWDRGSSSSAPSGTAATS